MIRTHHRSVCQLLLATSIARRFSTHHSPSPIPHRPPSLLVVCIEDKQLIKEDGPLLILHKQLMHSLGTHAVKAMQ